MQGRLKIIGSVLKKKIFFKRGRGWWGNWLEKSLSDTACSCSVTSVTDSLRPCGLLPTRLLCPWDYPGKILEWLPCPSPGSSWPRDQTLCLTESPALQVDSLPLSNQGSPITLMTANNFLSLTSTCCCQPLLTVLPIYFWDLPKHILPFLGEVSFELLLFWSRFLYSVFKPPKRTSKGYLPTRNAKGFPPLLPGVLKSLISGHCLQCWILFFLTCNFSPIPNDCDVIQR